MVDDEFTSELPTEIDPVYFRGSEAGYLLGDASKAKKILGWRLKLKIDYIIKIMVNDK